MKAYCINLDNRPEKWKIFQEQDFPFPVERFPAIGNKIGHLGCIASHCELFSRIDTIPFVVFEDDCQMLRDWEVVEECMKQLPYNWDMLYLGATLNEKLERYSENLFWIKNAYTTHAIIYNNFELIDMIVENKDKIHKIDVFITKEIHTRFNCFITYPLIATQRAGYSDIIRKKVDYNVITENYRKYASK